ncbi:hypothetical protein [Streptomyces sp. bgisy032]|uniref:hypothetical protein n=1 Tax=Streptomyces sp. bgisy032 TaxID=3413773 RepID=UPI003D7329ED
MLQIAPHGVDGSADGRRQGGSGAPGAVEPPVASAHLGRRRGEGVDQGAVRQAEQPPGRLGGQAGLHRVPRRVAFHLGGEPVP